MYNIILTVTTYIVILYRETTIMEVHHTIILYNQVWADKLDKLIGYYITYILDKTRMICRSILYINIIFVLSKIFLCMCM